MAPDSNRDGTASQKSEIVNQQSEIKNETRFQQNKNQRIR